MKKFSCEKCKYSTNIKDCITKHYLTKKYLIDNANSFACNSCDKIYKTQSGLCHHKHRCKKGISDTSNLSDVSDTTGGAKHRLYELQSTGDENKIKNLEKTV